MNVKCLDDLLTTALYTAPADATLAAATAIMKHHQLSSLLIEYSGEPVGIITERDILAALANNISSCCPVSQVMSKPVVSAPGHLEFREGYHQLALHNIRHLLITDRQGYPKGILSEGDFRSHLSSSFISRMRDIRGLMSSHTLTVPKETSALEALRTMAEHRFSCVIATDNEIPCGILTEYDAVKLYNDACIDVGIPLYEVMKSPVKTVAQDTSVPVALEQLQEHNIRHLVVVDNNEKVVGLITEHDIVHQIEIEFASRVNQQQKLSQSEIRRYEHKLHAIFDTTNIFLVLLDTDGHVLEINAAALKVSGFRREEVLHKPIWDTVWRTEDRVQQHRIRKVLIDARQGISSQMDTQHLDARGKLRFCDCRFQPIESESEITEYVLVEGLDVTDLKTSQQQLKHLAFYDPLTNLPNRTLLSERMTEALRHSRQSGQLLSIGYLDLDHFKPVNDNLGHEVGDQLLIDVASRLQNASRQHDTIARLGGDEFVLLMPNMNNQQQAEDVIQRMLEQIAAPYTVRGHTITISASIGLTLFPNDDCDPDMLLRHADQAMYHAKQLGRNRYYLFDADENDAIDHRRSWVQQAYEGLANNEFTLYFQPKVDMPSGAVIGAEALIRWQHPTKGLLQPSQFLPQLQSDPVMSAVDNWVLEQSIAQLHSWRAQGLDLSMNVNVSGQRLMEKDFVSTLEQLLGAYPQLPADALELEILENTALENIADAGEIINRCRELGVSFALDDFGTGYSSLTHLKRLPADTIKIDCSFVSTIMDNPEDLAIVEGIMGLATAFRKKTVAEGVEDIEQGIMLMHLGCNIAQGFGIALPMPGEQFPEWMRNYTPDPSWQTAKNVQMPMKNFPLLAASVDHRSWVSRIISYVKRETHEVMPHDSLDHTTCRFGLWLNSDGYAHFGHSDHWQQVDQIHKAIHRQSNEMLALLDENQEQAAQEKIPSLLQKRDELLNILSQWYADANQAV